MFRAFLLSVGLLATLLPRAICAPFDAVDVNLAEGIKAYESRNFGVAMDRFTHALLLSPSNPEIRNYISLTEQRLAQSSLNRPLNPAELQAIVRRAQEVLQRRRLKAAQTLEELKIAYKESELQNPNSLLEACRGIDIVVDVTLGDDSESLLIKHYVKSICAHVEKNAAKNADALAAQIQKIQGYLAFCRSDWRAAVDHWNHALEISPDDKHLAALLEHAKRHLERSRREAEVSRLIASGEQALAARQFAKASAFFDAVLNLNPYHQKALEQLKISREKGHDFLLAPVAAWTRQALASQESGDLITAARYWLIILEIDPVNDSARRNLDRSRTALMKELHSNINDAATDNGARSAAQNRAAKELYTLGLIQYSQSRLIEARSSLRDAARLNPDDGYIQNALKRVERELDLPR